MKELIKLFLLTFLISATYADVKELVIFQTNDIHGYLRKEWQDNQNGFLALATVIKTERNKYLKNSLLIDCGDLIQGSFIASKTKGQIGVTFLNELKYDIWVPGNHEFDFGIDVLTKIIQQVDCDVLMANINLEKNISSVKPWSIYHKNGIKIAVLGITYPTLDNYIWGAKLKGFKTTSIMSNIDKYMFNILTQKPDIIILAVHQGLFGSNMLPENNIYNIAKCHPEIDIILGGHIHNETSIKINNSWYSQSAHHADSLLKLTVLVDNSKHKVLNIQSEQIYITSDIKEDDILLHKLKKNKTPSKTYKSIKLDKSNFSSPKNITKLIANSLSSASGAKFVFFSIVPDFVKLDGDITEKKLFLAAPFEDSIGVLNLTKEDVIKIINEQNHFNIANKLELYYFNNKTILTNFEALKKISTSERVKIAFSSYFLAGAGGKLQVLKSIAKNKKVTSVDTRILIRDAFKSFLITHNKTPFM